MAFFMVMYALSRVDSEKFEALASSLTDAFNNPAGALLNLGVGADGRISIVPRKPKDPATSDDPNSRPSKYRDIEKMRGEFLQLVKEGGLGQAVTVTTNSEGDRLVVRLSDSLLFQPGSASLGEEAKELLAQVAAILVKAGKPVRIEGHTDNIPIRSGRFESNWHLSTARATSVLVYLVDEFGLPPELLSPAGYGEYRPVDTNATPEGRAKNRRVEFVILNSPDE